MDHELPSLQHDDTKLVVMLKKYLFLTKPGILFGNFVTTLGGYFAAAQGSVDFLSSSHYPSRYHFSSGIRLCGQ